MGTFDSVITWLEDIFKPLKDLYDRDSGAFFLGAILVILVLLIIVIILARRAEYSEDKPSKKVKYEDIDWTFHDESKETPAAEPVQRIEVKPEPVKKPEPEKYGVGELDVDKKLFGQGGLSPEVAEALINSIRRQTEGLNVPDWMAKQTLSIDDLESIDAQAWLEEQLQKKEVKIRDMAVERATVARIASILEKVERCDQFHEAEKQKACDEAVAKAMVERKEVPTEETVPEPSSEPEIQEPEPYASDTLSKILKEAEDIREENEIETLLNHIENGTAYKEPEDTEVPQWDIAATLAKLEAENSENDRILRELERESYDGNKVSEINDIINQIQGHESHSSDTGVSPSEDIDQTSIDRVPEEAEPVHVSEPAPEPVWEIPAEEPERPEPAVIAEKIAGEDPDRIEPSFFGTLKRPIKRFGVNNRDTNRSGKKFTEEELIKQIRD